MARHNDGNYLHRSASRVQRHSQPAPPLCSLAFKAADTEKAHLKKEASEERGLRYSVRGSVRPILKPPKAAQPSNKNEFDVQLLSEFISTVYKNVAVKFV